MIKKNLKKIKEYLQNARKILAIYYKANKKGFWFMLLGIIVISIVPFIHAYILKIIIDEIISLIGNNSHSFNSLYVYIGLMVVLSLISRVTWRIVEYHQRLNYLDFKKYLDILLGKKFSNLGFEHYSNPKTNDLFNRVKEMYQWRAPNFASRQLWMVQNIIEIISNSIALIFLNFWVFAGIVIVSIPEFFIIMKYGKSVWGLYAAKGSVRREYWETLYYVQDEKYLEEIKIFGSGNYLVNRLRRLYDDFLKLQKSKEKSKFKQTILSSFFTLIVFSISEIYIFVSAISQKISIGSLSFYTGRMYKLSENLQSLFKNLGESYDDLLYIKDLFEVLALKSEVKSKKEAIKLKPKARKIEFKNVSFKYPKASKYALENLSFTIKPYEKVAFIGENGGGKTTIVRLLCRFFNVTKGQILIDGKDIKDLDINSWYKSIGVLFQEFNQYAYSVKENIYLGNVDKNYEQALFEKALKKSKALDFVKEYEFGHETILSKRFKGGVQPSVGQWQKIALARAFFRDAPILILDEPTSAIDAKSEADIFKQLDQFEKNKTVIMISHRFSTVRNVDRIYIIEKGKIIEQGSHEQLIEKNGRYAKLFKLQAKGYQK